MAVLIETDQQVAGVQTQTVKNGSGEYRLSVDDYEKMIDHGIFDDEDKIELWNGKLLIMSPKGVKHANALRRIDLAFEPAEAKGAVLSFQDPIKLDDFSEPEPNFAMLCPPLEKYDIGHPTAAETYLILEIADSTLVRDREKAGDYARNGIEQYLILNVNANEIEDYREPVADGYRSKRTYRKGEKFTLVAFPDVEILVSDRLPSK